MKNKDTSIELEMQSILNSLGIKYTKQYYIGTYPVDFYLPKYNLTIQVQGCWFHFCDDCFKDKKPLPRHIFQKRRDKACQTYHKYKSINLLYIWEHEFKNKTTLKAKLIEKLKSL